MSTAHFKDAVEHIRRLPKNGPVQMDNNTKLKFYALYKQATEGDVKGARPWAVKVEARAKWDAWNAQKGMSANDAKAAYVMLLMKVTKEKGHPWTPKVASSL